MKNAPKQYVAHVETRRGPIFSRAYDNKVAAKGQATRIRSELDDEFVLYSEVVTYIPIRTEKWPEDK